MTQSRWRREARRVIEEVGETIEEDAPLGDRIAAIDAAYPFGPRKYFPYKMWLLERREYLQRYGYASKGKPKNGSHIVGGQVCESPLERLMRRGRGKA